MTAQKAAFEAKRPEFRLDILIKKQDNYYIAHCLQFDLVTTHDTLEGAQESIVETCISHIIFSIKNNNIEYLFSPAPKEVWAEYYSKAENESCKIINRTLTFPEEEKISYPKRGPFILQEVLCYA